MKYEFKNMYELFLILNKLDEKLPVYLAHYSNSLEEIKNMDYDNIDVIKCKEDIFCFEDIYVSKYEKPLKLKKVIDILKEHKIEDLKKAVLEHNVEDGYIFATIEELYVFDDKIIFIY